MNKSFTFNSLPKSVAELSALPESSMSDPYATAALTVLALCEYENAPQASIDMLNFLKGVQPLSPYEIQFIRDRLSGKGYVPRSYLADTSPDNNYQPSVPYTVTVFDNPYSNDEQGYIKLFIQSSGADSPRPIKMRLKPSTNQWFLWEQFLLSDIRMPKADDPWA